MAVNKIVGGQYSDMPYTDSTIWLDHAHHEIHTGNHWVFAINDAALANGATLNLLFITSDETTSDTPSPNHMYVFAEADGACTVAFYEDTVTSNNGTAQTAKNRNRLYNETTRPSKITPHTTPTITDTGVELGLRYIGATSGAGGSATSSAGDSRDVNEFVLKYNTKYLLRITNTSGSARRVIIGGDWYRHDIDAHKGTSYTMG